MSPTIVFKQKIGHFIVLGSAENQVLLAELWLP